MCDVKSLMAPRCLSVVLAVFALVLSGCQFEATPTVTPRSPDVVLVVNPFVTDVAAGHTVALAAEVSGSDLRFRWSASRGKLSAFDTPAVIYTAPDSEGVDTVTVEVSSASGVTIKHVSFNVFVETALPPSSTPSITITSPTEKAVCPLNEECRFDVEGISSDVVSDPDLQAIVWVKDGLWFPHKWVTFESDGAWRRTTQIGHTSCWEVGYPFGIVAMVMPWEEAEAIPTDFQSLPQEYVALSDYVALETTYDAVSLDLSRAKSSSHLESGASIEMSRTTTSLTITYDLGVRGWAQATVPVDLDMSCMRELGFSIAFSLEGAEAANTIEVNLEDSSFTKYGWSRGRMSATDGVEQIEVPLGHLGYVGDPGAQDKNMNWSEVVNIFFAVSEQDGDDGGAGRVEISNVRFVLPTVP
jgi:hypothetical protein